MAGAPACFAKVAKHTGKKDAKKQIESMENQWRDAVVTGNIAEMAKILSDDYFGISMTGEVNTKAQQLERMQKRMLVVSKMELSDLKVKLIGTTAVVTSRAEVQGVNDGAPITGAFRYTRVYQKTAAGLWQITNFEATRLARQGPPPDPEAKP
jgi:ketosteroid isomerase-like protein